MSQPKVHVLKEIQKTPNELNNSDLLSPQNMSQVYQKMLIFLILLYNLKKDYSINQNVKYNRRKQANKPLA